MSMLTITKLTSTVGAEVTGLDSEQLGADDALAGCDPGSVGGQRGSGVSRPEPHSGSPSRVLHPPRRGGPVRPTGAIRSPASTRSPWTSPRTPAPTTCGPRSSGTSTAAHRLNDECPQKATVLSAKQVADEGGETEFASAYTAYDMLSDEDKQRLGSLRVVHSLEASQRKTTPDPSPEDVARWRSRPTHEHPLVWTHRSGRKSLVLGASADYIVGMDLDEGRAVLDRTPAVGHRSGQCLQPHLVRRGHRHLGQPRRHAPRRPVRRRLRPIDVAHHGVRRRTDRVTSALRPALCSPR